MLNPMEVLRERVALTELEAVRALSRVGLGEPIDRGLLLDITSRGWVAVDGETITPDGVRALCLSICETYPV